MTRQQIEAIYGSPIVTVKVSLTAAQIKTLNSVPIVVPGTVATAGKYYRVMSADSNYIPISQAFSITEILVGGQVITGQGLDDIAPAFGVGRFANNGVITSNSAIYLVGDSDSASGDGSLDIYVSYREITM